MKILHVVPTYWPATRYGGPIYSVHGLCAALAQSGVEVSVFTTSVDGSSNSDVEHDLAYVKDGVSIYYYESALLRRIYYSKQLKSALNRRIHEFDLIHLHSVFLYPTNIAARIARQNNIPYVLTPRGMLEKALIKNKSSLVKSIWLKCIEQKTIEQSKLLHLTSEREYKQLQAFNYNIADHVVIPNGVDRASKRVEYSGDQSHLFQILYLGRINWKKQIELIIRSLTYVDFPIKFVIAGNDEDGYKSKLDQLIRELKLSSRADLQIEFSGEVLGGEKENLFKQSDVMILTSKSENFGNTVIEAMARGCPVIVSAQVGASGVVEKAKAGLVTPADPESIAACISEIKNNPLRAQSMSENGVKEIQQHYLWPKIAQSMINAYQKVISAHG